jgi:hypothetical protein
MDIMPYRFNEFSGLDVDGQKPIEDIAAGEGKEWHHIVEQSQIGKSGFAKEMVHNPDNMIALDKSVHRQITAFYNSTKNPITNGLSVREWLAGQSFEYQYEYGMKVLRQFGVL